jgi:hypothetical protein
LWLIGSSIQAGWVLIHLFLLVAFGGAGHQPSKLPPNGELGWQVFHNPDTAS